MSRKDENKKSSRNYQGYKMKVSEVTTRRNSKTKIVENIAEILNDYNHPSFDAVFEKVMKEYYDNQSDK